MNAQILVTELHEIKLAGIMHIGELKMDMNLKMGITKPMM